ncbi:polysaccharide biosynthesis tyrosine autokinase [Gordonia hongkongensis]|uniref:polysaccharide biosynthesis tyrosine autokinase n=1 Tax=Gordonia hongkongensis TaxID=1701090 RepID=UPI003EBCA320
MNVDYTRLVQVVVRELKRSWWVVIGCALLGGVMALALSWFTTPMFRSTSSVYVTSGATDANSISAYQGSLASEQRVESYAKLAQSEIVIQKAIDDSGLDISLPKAVAAVEASPLPGTVMLSISASSPDRYLAAELTNAVALAMTGYVETLEKPTGGGDPLAKLTVVTRAVPSVYPVSPKTQRNVGVGLVGGCVVGLIGAAARHRFDSKVRSSDDLSRLTDQSVLASIPTDSSLCAGGSIDFSTGSSSAAEAYRKLRTNLSFVRVDMPTPVVLVTSPSPGEGKTTTAVNLAFSLAENGNRVVLVDADLRRPSVAVRLGINGDLGLTNFVSGGAALTDLIQTVGDGVLQVLASGPIPPNPAELLDSFKARDLFRALSESYDYVIIDSPPVLPVTDSSIIARWADGVLLVVRSDATNSRDVVAAISQLSNSQSGLLGTVLNGVDPTGGYERYTYYGRVDQNADVAGDVSGVSLSSMQARR